MECPELGGEGEARVDDVMDEGMKPRPVLSRPREDGGMGGLSKATLTRLSISSARNSVFSFSSWISLRFKITTLQSQNNVLACINKEQIKMES